MQLSQRQYANYGVMLYINPKENCKTWEHIKRQISILNLETVSLKYTFLTQGSGGHYMKKCKQ
jgi:ABC-type enterochelin transport system ATPase subunit